MQSSNDRLQLTFNLNIDSPKLSQKEAFLKHLQEMNLDMLDLVLRNDATYVGFIVPHLLF